MKRWIWLLLLIPAVVQAVTSEELRLMAGEVERDQRLRESRVDPDALGNLLPHDKRTIATPPAQHEAIQPDKPQSTKYHRPASPDNAGDLFTVTTKETTKNRNNLYVPPPRVMGAAARITTDAVTVAQRRFGIRLGTWIPARLERTTTSSDPGLVELVLTQDVDGDHRTLAKGTLLFARKAYNQGTKRLDLQIVKIITPEGHEMKVNALVYDHVRVAGLIGAVSGPPMAATVKTGLVRGLLESSQLAMNTLGDSSLVNTLGDTAVNEVVNNQREVLDEQQLNTYTIRVTAQDVLIRIEETF